MQQSTLGVLALSFLVVSFFSLGNYGAPIAAQNVAQTMNGTGAFVGSSAPANVTGSGGFGSSPANPTPSTNTPAPTQSSPAANGANSSADEKKADKKKDKPSCDPEKEKEKEKECAAKNSSSSRNASQVKWAVKKSVSEGKGSPSCTYECVPDYSARRCANGKLATTVVLSDGKKKDDYCPEDPVIGQNAGSGGGACVCPGSIGAAGLNWSQLAAAGAIAQGANQCGPGASGCGFSSVYSSSNQPIITDTSQAPAPGGNVSNSGVNQGAGGAFGGSQSDTPVAGGQSGSPASGSLGGQQAPGVPSAGAQGTGGNSAPAAPASNGQSNPVTGGGGGGGNPAANAGSAGVGGQGGSNFGGGSNTSSASSSGSNTGTQGSGYTNSNASQNYGPLSGNYNSLQQYQPYGNNNNGLGRLAQNVMQQQQSYGYTAPQNYGTSYTPPAAGGAVRVSQGGISGVLGNFIHSLTGAAPNPEGVVYYQNQPIASYRTEDGAIVIDRVRIPRQTPQADSSTTPADLVQALAAATIAGTRRVRNIAPLLSLRTLAGDSVHRMHNTRAKSGPCVVFFWVRVVTRSNFVVSPFFW